MKSSRKSYGTVGDNESFVTLIRVAREDDAVRKTLQAILAQPAFHRKSMLHMLISDMQRKSASQGFILAISCLLDDDVAAKAKEAIHEN